MRGPIYVAVVGSGDSDTKTDEVAEEVGRLIAEAGAVLVCGGLTGVMAAACRGAHSVGGTTVGILPGDDRRAANPYVDVAVATGLGEARNTVVVRAADVVIAVAGEFGTLSEIGFALKVGTPVVGVGTWELARAGDTVDAIARAETPDLAVNLALGLATDR